MRGDRSIRALFLGLVVYPVLGLAAFLVSASVTADALAKNSERSKFVGQMVSTGVDSNASGKLKWNLRESRGKLDLRARGLDPSTTYFLLIDSTVQGTLKPKKNGTARLRFRSPNSRGQELLDFDPRGVTIALSDGAEIVLEAVGSGEGEPRRSTSLESTGIRARLESGASFDMQARFRAKKNGRKEFKFEVRGAEPGDYRLFVDGIERAEIPVKSKGRGKVRFRSPSKRGSLPLDFDPRGAVLDLVAVDTVVGSGPLAAQIKNINVCAFRRDEVPLVSVAATGGEAKARHRIRTNCDQDLRIEVEDVPERDYAVCQGDTLIGSLVALDNGDEVEGEIEFSRQFLSDDKRDPEEAPLDFEVDLSAISIRSPGESAEPGGTCPETAVLFDGGSEPAPDSCSFEELTVRLPATAAPGARGGEGKARYRVREDCEADLDVEIEDLPAAGTTAVCVGGLFRGRISTTDDGTGEIEGEIEFESIPDEGETRLDFDVDLATVEVREDDPDAAAGDACPDTALLFGVAETEPEICSFLELELPLLNIGPDPDAKGKVRLRRDSSCSRDLRVEIEKLPQGDYHLVFRNPGGDEPVMEIPKSFQEIDPDHGEIEGEWVLDGNPDPGEILFPSEIEPLGMRITIEQGGTTFLERVFE